MKILNDINNFSLRTIFIYSFIALLVTTVSIIGYVVFSNWLESTNTIINKVEMDVNGDIVNAIEGFVDIPLHINEANYGFIQNKIVDVSDQIKRELFFAGVLKSNNEDVYSFSYGTEKGEYYGALRNEKNEIEIIRNNAETNGHSWLYSTTRALTAGKRVVDAGKFDARTRDWYMFAKDKKKPGFSPVYKHFVVNDLAISASYPIYGENGLLRGVLGTHIILSKMNKFLKEIVKEKKAKAYIVETKSGTLIAHSLDMPSFKLLGDGTFKRRTIQEIHNPAIQKAYRSYKNNKNNKLIIKTKNDLIHMNLADFKREGLDWLIITAIPESEYKAGIYRNIQITVLLTIVILILSTVIYLKATNIILHPVYHLINVTEEFSKGNLLSRAEIFRNDEIGKLSETFNKMAQSLYMLINTLEDKVKERTLELEETNISLKQSKEDLQLLLDSTYEAIFGADTQGNCTFCNNSCLKMLGYKHQDDLMGKNMHWLNHHSQKDGTILPQEECRILTTLNHGEGVHGDDEVFWRSDGTSFDVEYFSYPQYKEGVLVGAVVTFLDISERKKAESDIIYLSYHDSLTGLYNRRFFEEELRRLDTARNLPISIISGDVNGLKLANDIFGHAAGDRLLQKAASALKRSCRADDIIARTGGDEFIIVLPKTSYEEAEKIGERIKNQFSKERIEVLRGSISLGCGTKNLENENILQAIENADERMYAQKVLDRRNFSTAMIKAIMNSLHAKSIREERHSKNVSELCQEIGRTIHLSEPKINQLKEAGLMHDIGKIALKEGILDKTAPLTHQEWQAIKQHPLLGFRILNSCEDMSELAQYVLSHHERWDGSGYPKGLKGEAIPKLARIIAIADSYEAMTNDRAYRKAMGREEATLEIQKNAGTQFDPEIAAAFIEMLNGGGLAK